MKKIKAPLPGSTKYFLNTLSNISKSSIKNIDAYPLKGDASDRSYFRLTYNHDKKGKSSVIIMQLTNPPIKKDIPFVAILDYLMECGIKVPELYFFDKEKGFIFIEDLGDVSLEKKLKTSDASQQEKYYKKALDTLIHMQTDCTYHLNKSIPAYHKAFDLKKLTWELNFMTSHFIEGFLNISISKKDKRILDEEFFKICSVLARQKKYFCHRDFHSRNIMLNNDRLTLIDFQDAMMGPCQYDLASLLRDSYFKISSGLLDRLLKYYINKKEEKEQVSVNRDDFLMVFDWMSIQRNLKALGTFGYQVSTKRNERYKEAIPRTMEYIWHNLNKYNELKRLKKYIEILYNSHLE